MTISEIVAHHHLNIHDRQLRVQLCYRPLQERMQGLKALAQVTQNPRSAERKRDQYAFLEQNVTELFLGEMVAAEEDWTMRGKCGTGSRRRGRTGGMFCSIQQDRTLVNGSKHSARLESGLTHGHLAGLFDPFSNVSTDIKPFTNLAGWFTRISNHSAMLALAATITCLGMPQLHLNDLEECLQLELEKH